MRIKDDILKPIALTLVDIVVKASKVFILILSSSLKAPSDESSINKCDIEQENADQSNASRSRSGDIPTSYFSDENKL